MKNSEALLKERPDRTDNERRMAIPYRLVILFLVISFMGFIDAGYLSLKYYSGELPDCSILEGCETVAQSEYADIRGVPISLFGVIDYLFLFILTVAFIDTKKEKIFRFAFYLTIAGFAVSLALVYLQIFVIKAICIYCMISALISTLLFILGIFILLRLSASSGKKYE